MILKSIKLENIRSYLNQQIDFPTGSVLLSGDIGCGKSTILLAIEFALFGVKRKELSGSALLRHGKKQGSVELKFNIDKKEIIVKRVLKRGKDDVKQEAGYIVIDGVKKAGTHIELRTDILNLLGYPKDLVTKSKDLVYRYTVYTPQEDMKQIVYEDKDVRLDTLRKVFNIDKYKKIRENSQIFIRDLKEKRKNYEGRIADLEDKKKALVERKNEVVNIDKELIEVLPKVELVKKEVQEKKKLILQREKQITDYNKTKKEIELEELKLKNNLEKRKLNNNEIIQLGKEIDNVRKQLESSNIKNVEEFLKGIKDKETQLNFFRKTVLEINKKLAEFETRKKSSVETKAKVERIDECPLCLQNVGSEHKTAINRKEDDIIKDLNDHIIHHKEQEVENKAKILGMEKEINDLRKKQMEIKAIMVKKEALVDKEKRKVLLEENQEKNKQEIGKINMKKIELNKKLESIGKVEEDYKKLRQELEVKAEEYRKLELSKKELEVKKEEISKLLKSLDEEIKSKEEIKVKLSKITQYQHWLDEHFVKLMGTIEKHVMLQVYREFNDLFKQWFSMLIADETLNVRLDDEFTPLVEQNGYENNISNLSGGERTSVALAYRLALNRVINDVIGNIKTKNILILDEPTDGFSSEQLDKVRDVLEEINVKQVIIVSHESKIESFVDNVVRISKREHVSEIG